MISKTLFLAMSLLPISQHSEEGFMQWSSPVPLSSPVIDNQVRL